MNLPRFDITKFEEMTYQGECVRLAESLRPKKAGARINLNGQKMQMYTKKGMHVEDCDVKQLTQYLLTVDESCGYEVKLFVLRIFQIRFPAEFEAFRRQRAAPTLANEMELMGAYGQNEEAWFGRVGFVNEGRLDGLMYRAHKKTVRRRNELVETVDR